MFTFLGISDVKEPQGFRRSLYIPDGLANPMANMPIRGLPEPAPIPSWTPKGQTQTIEASIGELTIRGAVKKYRHNEETLWEYSIEQSGEELTFKTGFQSAEEARKAALEQFKDAVQVASENLNTELQ